MLISPLDEGKILLINRPVLSDVYNTPFDSPSLPSRYDESSALASDAYTPSSTSSRGLYVHHSEVGQTEGLKSCQRQLPCNCQIAVTCCILLRCSILIRRTAMTTFRSKEMLSICTILFKRTYARLMDVQMHTHFSASRMFSNGKQDQAS